MDNLQQTELLEKIAIRLRVNGPTSMQELLSNVKISRPQLSRYLTKLKSRLAIIGRGKNTRYAHKRDIPQAGNQIAIYSVNEKGKLINDGALYPIAPKGFYYETEQRKRSRLFDDLPYFLNDLRPAGFLGRLTPRAYPDWGFPEDVRLWTAESTLRYLTNFGWDLIGNQIVGEIAAQKFLKETMQELETVKAINEIGTYEELANTVEKFGIPGSSAGGEHPKFTTRRAADHVPVIVKFVQNNDNAITRRRIDLLRAENIASELLSTRGREAPTRIIEGPSYTFLEITRFDRLGLHGRKGMISLLSLDAEFVGSGESWSVVAQKLLNLNIIEKETADETQFREYFGNFIGNSDMHGGNISFFFERGEVIGITPVYDMLPMMYAPVQERISMDTIIICPPKPQSIKLWERARELSIRYWQKIQETEGFSSTFIDIAKRNEKLIKDSPYVT